MNVYEKRDIIIYINMFVHYPETYNANTISSKFNSYLNEYFFVNKIIDAIYNHDCYVKINSAPHSQEESLKIEVCFFNNKLTSIDKETILLKLKEFVIDYFNSQIKDYNIEYVSNK